MNAQARNAIDVSVVIPAHNRAAIISQTVDSVLAQENCRFEVIVIDDGSTDDTAKVLAQYGDRIGVLRQLNSGAAVARNRGARAARGRYLAFCDDDDIWLPNHLCALREYLDAHPKAGLAFSDAAFFHDQPSNVSRSMMRQKYRRLLGRRKLTPRDLFLKCVITTLSVVMVRREVFQAIGFFDERIRLVDDMDLAFRVSLDHDVGFVNNLSCSKRLLQESLTVTIAHDDGYLKIIEDRAARNPRLTQQVGVGTFRRRLASEFHKSGRRLLSQENRGGALAAFGRARVWAWWNLGYQLSYLNLKFSRG